MKRASSIVLTLLVTIISFGQKKCTLKGEVINRPSKTLLLKKSSVSQQFFLNNPVKISISNGRFEYSFTFEDEEAYLLIFEDELNEGTWAAIIFFPIEGVVEFQLHPKKDFDKNIVKGGALNAEFAAYQKRNKEIFENRRSQLFNVLRELNRNGELNTPGYEALRAKLRALSSDDHDGKVLVWRDMKEMEKTHTNYTEKAKKEYFDPYDSLTRAEIEWKYEYVAKNISPVSYYLMWRDVELKSNSKLAGLVSSVYPLYQKKYPEHVYTKVIGTQLEGLQTVNIGNRFIDFKAPTLAGDTIQLSSAIQNKIALINFWGSWCGPCIAKTKLIAPVYEQYKDKGFSIVGIAREFKSTDAVKKRLDKENYPWINLIELDDKLNIWTKYGISNGTGMMVLVDNDGTILALDPGPEELESILKKKLPEN